MKAMILAAGLGTRLKPFTDHHPKALAVVNGKTLLSRNIEYLRAHGIGDIIVNVHHFADQIIQHIEESSYTGIYISDETEAVLETGGGLKKASWFFEDGQPFVVMNADILTNLNLSAVIQFHQQHHALATLAVSNRNSSRCFLFNPELKLCGWRNNKTGEEKISIPKSDYLPMAFSGIHIINPAIFKLISQEGKFSMVDVYLALASSHHIQGYDHSGSILMDVGKPESLAEAALFFP